MNRSKSSHQPPPSPLPAAGLSVLIIGDAMVDTYLDSNPVGISDEAPVLVLDWVATERTFGGMLNTATTLAALGFQTQALGLVNEADAAGSFVREECTRLGIQQHWVSDGRPTTEKARVRTNPQHSPIAQLARIDDEADTPLDGDFLTRIQAQFTELCASAQVIVISDYCKGLLTPEFAAYLIETARERQIPILVDAKPATFNWYAGATLLTPNEAEARRFAAEVFGEVEAAQFDLPSLAKRLAEHLHAGILLTCAAAGMYLVLPPGRNGGEDKDGNGDEGGGGDGGVQHIPAPPVAHVESTSGAGDVVLAVMALAAARSETLVSGAHWASQAVACTLTRKGTCTLTNADIVALAFD